MNVGVYAPPAPAQKLSLSVATQQETKLTNQWTHENCKKATKTYTN